MAVRGINVFEKHIEKLFLGLAAAGLAGVLVWQYAGAPSSVKVSNTDVPLDQAYPKLEEQAKRLQAQMRDPNPSTPPAVAQHVNLLEGYKSKLTSNVAPSPTMWAPPGYPLAWVKTPGGGNPDAFFLIPALPGTTKPVARAFMSTVHESEVAAYPGLADLMYGVQAAPYDKAAVSVETTFNPPALLEALKSDPDGAGPALPLLQNWWEGTEIVAVDLVRQELDAKGQWSAEEVVQSMPGRTSFKERLAVAGLTTTELNQIVIEAGQNAEDLLRPDWYKRAVLNGFEVGEEWVQPAKAGEIPPEEGGGDADLAKMLRQLKGLNDRLNLLNKQKEKIQAQPAPRSGGGGGGGGAGGGGGGRRPGGGGGGAGGGGTPAPQPKDSKQEQLDSLQRQIDQVQKQIDTLKQKITDKGGKLPGNDAAPDPTKPVTPVIVPSLLKTTDPISVWAHDVSAHRGSTYRYQVRLQISNPVFNKPAQLRVQDKHLADVPTVTVPAAGWSDPVRVDDKVYYFIVGAQGADARNVVGGTATARAELYYFTWGYWRKTEVPLEPGDPIAGTVQVPDATKIAAAPAAPGALPAAPGGGKRPAPGEMPAPAAPGVPAAPVGIPMVDLPVERDAFLLDVPQNPISVSSVAGNKVTWSALVRDEGGILVLRDPQIERISPLFKRLEASAAAGKKFGTPGEGAPAPAPGNNPAPGVPSPPSMAPGRG